MAEQALTAQAAIDATPLPTSVLVGSEPALATQGDDSYWVLDGDRPEVMVNFTPELDRIPAGMGDQVKWGLRYRARQAAPGPYGADAILSFMGYAIVDGSWMFQFTFDNSRALPVSGEWVHHEDFNYAGEYVEQSWTQALAGEFAVKIVSNEAYGPVWFDFLQYVATWPGGGMVAAPLRVLQRGSDGLGVTGGRRVLGARTIQASSRVMGIR